jgi:hypothetical protein
MQPNRWLMLDDTRKQVCLKNKISSWEIPIAPMSVEDVEGGADTNSFMVPWDHIYHSRADDDNF